MCIKANYNKRIEHYYYEFIHPSWWQSVSVFRSYDFVSYAKYVIKQALKRLSIKFCFHQIQNSSVALVIYGKQNGVLWLKPDSTWSRMCFYIFKFCESLSLFTSVMMIIRDVSTVYWKLKHGIFKTIFTNACAMCYVLITTVWLHSYTGHWFNYTVAVAVVSEANNIITQQNLYKLFCNNIRICWDLRFERFILLLIYQRFF